MIPKKTDKRDSRLAAIDGMKGIGACIIAFFWHYQHFRPQNGSPFFSIFPVSYKNGYLMVELFFMLSGFGMMLGYSERVTGHLISFREFITKRLKKIYPPFLFFTALTIVLELIYRHRCGETFVYGNFDLQHLFQNLLLMQDGVFGTDWSFDAPSWCISICMLCYLLFYLILYHAKNERRACYVFFGTFLLGMAMILSKKELPLWNSLVGRGFTCFSVGAMLFEVYKYREKFRSQRLGYICLGIAVLSYLAARFRPEFTGDITTAFILGTAPSLILAVLLIPWLRAVLGFRPLAILGELSIVIYLVHFPVQCAIAVLNEYMSLGLDFSTKSVWLSYAAAVLISAAAYRYLISSPAEKLICGFFVKKKTADSKKTA